MKALLLALLLPSTALGAGRPGAPLGSGVGTGSIDTAKLATDSVTNAKILSFAVDSNKIDTGAVGTEKIPHGAIDTKKLLYTDFYHSTLNLGSPVITAGVDRLNVAGGATVTGAFNVSPGSSTFRGNIGQTSGLSTFRTMYAYVEGAMFLSYADALAGTNRSIYWDQNSWNFGTADRVAFTTGSDGAGTRDASLSRAGTNTIGVGTGAAGSVAGTLNTAKIIVNTTQTPASNAACTTGEITWDASYIYVCTASGAWKRAALTGGY